MKDSTKDKYFYTLRCLYRDKVFKTEPTKAAYKVSDHFISAMVGLGIAKRVGPGHYKWIESEPTMQMAELIGEYTMSVLNEYKAKRESKSPQIGPSEINQKDEPKPKMSFDYSFPAEIQRAIDTLKLYQAGRFFISYEPPAKRVDL